MQYQPVTFLFFSFWFLDEIKKKHVYTKSLFVQQENTGKIKQ